MTTGKAILAVVAGIAAGAALGILFAPDKGVYTRKKIVRKGEDLVDELGDTLERKYDALEEKIEDKVKGVVDKYFRVKPMKDRKAELVDN
jgi:gas vesicle protein